ncbi:MAG: aminoacyl-histidine dipeptidase [Rikenellaceae bacterium]|jgi:dipeptidase D|nr:aminoacyl-histidine dipeptidase [Rikenellaceae bacterium]
MSDIALLRPAAVWQEFEKITRVPRPSKKEGQIIEHLVRFAEENGLRYKKDAAGNVVIFKPATPSRKERPAVVLQSHMDMVCEKNSGVEFDFERDPIRTRIDKGWVRAEGTTLGADCGIGMAAALAVLKADDMEHPAIEALFTVDEETGLTGAFNLADDMISAKLLVNLDSEDEGEIFIGCAGGVGTTATFNYTPRPVPEMVFFRFEVSGLQGGHSGDDIDKGRANSNKVLARLLYGIDGLTLSEFNGGNLHNAIPREAWAVAGVPAGKVTALFEYFERFASEITAEYRYGDPDIDLSISEIPAPAHVMDDVSQQSLLRALVGVPNGVIAMSGAMPSLVETSTNLASVKFTGEGNIVTVTSQRSSVESAKRYVAASVESVFALAGASVAHNEGYPGWTPNPDSPLLGLTVESYRELFGVEPRVRAIHAGLECGLFLSKFPCLDMVSFGPTLRGVHSPDEQLEIASVEKFWQLLVALLGKI